ncbi:MAG: hypothetical protein JRI86_01295 [Deltaproteobacteria bacterium]|nr:hypothetical protein [Deltaproteobacteria bacterium]
MTEKKQTLGQAIDQIIEALDSLAPDARQTAIDAACSHLGIAKSTSVAPPQVVPQPTAALIRTPSLHETPPAHSPKVMDIRTFKESKGPKSAKQMACVVAYYLAELALEGEKRATVTSKVLEKYFKQGKFKLPKTIGQLLPDAKASGYFEAAPGKGEYALNAVGYNLVAHNLPTKKGK